MKLLLAILPTIFTLALTAQQAEPLELLQQMFDRCREVNMLEYTMDKQERVDGKMTRQRSFIRLHRDPFKIYLRQEVPRDGLEALYLEGANKDRILVNPNGFPWINLNLAVHSGLVRRDQHHTIDHSGYDYFIKVLSGSLQDESARQMAKMTCSSEIRWLDEPCWRLHILNPLYEEKKTRIGSDISLTNLSDSLHLCEYKIVELNRGLKPGEMVPAGSELVLPSHYAKEISIYVSTRHQLPVTFEVRDEQGVYERYDFLDIQVDPDLEQGEFDPDYSAYAF